jgi:hypothetical protein
MLFKMHSSGLHYYAPSSEDFNFINTVNKNKAGFTKRQITSADKARELYASLAYPSNADYKWILKSNQIKDCPVSIKDAEIATKIWGPNIAALKGKTMQSTPEHVITNIVKIPLKIQDLHKFITISIDIFFVNTVDEKKAVFTKRQIASADKARELYASLVYPSNAEDLQMDSEIQSNQRLPGVNRGCRGCNENLGA